MMKKERKISEEIIIKDCVMNIIEYVPYIGFLTPLILIIVFGYIINKRNLKLEIENKLTAVYSENCGGRFNGYNLSVPFVRLTIYTDFIIISYTKKVVLKYNDIVKIEIKKHFISKGIHIYHKRNDIPKNIIIWTANSKKIKEIIESKLKEL